MTDPRNYHPQNFEYVRRGEALGSDSWGWVLGTGAAVLIGFLILASFSDTTNNNTNTASNNAPNATSNSPPRIGPTIRLPARNLSSQLPAARAGNILRAVTHLEACVVALRFILVLLVAATGLLLLYHHLGTRESNDLSRASVSAKMSEARAISTERDGTKKTKANSVPNAPASVLRTRWAMLLSSVWLVAGKRLRTLAIA